MTLLQRLFISCLTDSQPWCQQKPTEINSSSPPSNYWENTDLTAWIWTGSIPPPGVAPPRTGRDLQPCVRSVRFPSEEPTSHRLNCLLSMQELLEAYEVDGHASGKPRLLLTAAVPANKRTIDAGFEIAEISKYEVIHHHDHLLVLWQTLVCISSGTWTSST